MPARCRNALGAFAFEPRAAAAPLPCAPQFLHGSAFPMHGELMAKAFGQQLPPGVYGEAPLMYQGTSDNLLGPTDDVVLPSEDDGIDFEGVCASAVASRSRPGSVSFKRNRARASRRLPLPDELGVAWRNGRVALPLRVEWNGRLFGFPNAAAMAVSFPELIAFAARRRTLGAGTIVGSGTISNENYAEVGSTCIAERRMIEQLNAGRSTTAFMKFGDRVRMEMFDAAGASIFGAIDQCISPLA